MVIAIGLTVSKIDRGQRSEGLGHSEMDYIPLKCSLGLYTRWPTLVEVCTCWLLLVILCFAISLKFLMF